MIGLVLGGRVPTISDPRGLTVKMKAKLKVVPTKVQKAEKS